MTSSTENVKLGVCTVLYDDIDLGFTKGGVTVEVQTSTHEMNVDQMGQTPIGELITGRTVSATVPLAETTVELLVKIMPGARLVPNAADPSRPLAIVSTGVNTNLLATAKTLVLRPKGTNGEDDFLIHRAACPGALNFAYQFDSERVFNAVFKGYAGDDSSLFQIGDNVLDMTLSTFGVDENQAAGARVASVRLLNAGTRVWSYSMVDDDSGIFAVSEDGDLVVGADGLSRAAKPVANITVEATNTVSSIRRSFQVAIRKPLPALPLAVGAKVFGLGDSYVGYGVYIGSPVSITGAGGLIDSGYGFINWARAKDPRFYHENWFDTADPLGRNVSGANQGVFGDHVYWADGRLNQGIINRLPGVLARKPDILVMDIGTNTVNSGDDVPASYDYFKERIGYALDLVRNEGVQCILLTAYPRRDWPAGDKRYAMLDVLNSIIRSMADRDGVTVLDPEARLAPSGEQDVTMFTADKVHLSAKGNRYIGQALLLPVLQQMVAPGSVYDLDPTINNILTASVGQMTGKTGSKGANVTGDVATGVGVTVGRSLISAVCSMDDLGNGLFGQRIVATPDPNSAAGGAYWEADVTLPQQFLSGGLFSATDWVSCMVYVEKLSGDDMAAPRFQLQAKNGGTIVATAWGMYTDSGSFAAPLVAKDGAGWWIRTHPFNLKALGTFDRLQPLLQVFGPKAGTNGPVTFRVSKPILRKINDPRPLFGYPAT